jgi:hypothetical protein
MKRHANWWLLFSSFFSFPPAVISTWRQFSESFYVWKFHSQLEQGTQGFGGICFSLDCERKGKTESEGGKDHLKPEWGENRERGREGLPETCVMKYRWNTVFNDFLPQHRGRLMSQFKQTADVSHLQTLSHPFLHPYFRKVSEIFVTI